MIAWLKSLWRRLFGTGADIARPVYPVVEVLYYSKTERDEDRRKARRAVQWARWIERRPTGCPRLTGERLRKTLRSCDPRNLLVQPRYRRVK
jgi:hypothetical protein